MKPAPHPEEPEWQWLEDGITALAGVAFALVAALGTLSLNLVVAVANLFRRAKPD